MGSPSDALLHVWIEMDSDISIVPYGKHYSRDDFRCGQVDLDDWLTHQASQQQKSGNTRTFLAISETQNRVVGYYSTTTYRLGLDEAAVAFGSGKRRYPVPAILLARLAVDEAYQGRGVGAGLLIHALFEIASASKSVGFEVLVVHAINSEAVTFYAKAGFTRFEDHPLHLYMPIRDLFMTIKGH